MPRENKAIKKAKAKKLTKAYIKSGLNQNRLAKKLKTSRQNINRKINKKEVQDCLKHYLDSPELKEKLISVAKDGLEADKSIVIDGSIEEVSDHGVRHKYWHDLMNIKGHIKDAGTAPVNIFTIGDIITQIGELENVPTSKRSKKLD